MIWVILVYAVFGLITYGATFSYFQSKWPELAQEGYAEDMGMAIFCAIIPPMWFAVPFMTEFYRYGLKFK